MFAKVKSSTFIDSLVVELGSSTEHSLTAILRDDSGAICSKYETKIFRGQPNVTWEGLNHLPYGVYTLELRQGEQQVRLRMVKRV